MYKRICLTCGISNESQIVPTKEGYEICTCCGGSIFDVVEEEATVQDNELLVFWLQQESVNIF